MARYKEASYSRSATINLGNYESTKIEISVVAEFDKGDNVDGAYEELVNQVDNALKQKIDDIELGKREAKSKAKRFGV